VVFLRGVLTWDTPVNSSSDEDVTIKTPSQDLGEPIPGIKLAARSVKFRRHSRKFRSSRPFVLNNTIICPSVRRLFVDNYKSQKKLKAISPDLKKSAIHHFPTTLAYSSNIVAAPGRSRRLAEKDAACRPANVITQEDTGQDEYVSATNEYGLPHTVLSYNTVQSTAMRRYVLEDVLQCEVGDDLLILVSPLHVNYVSFCSVADIAPPLPLRGHRGVPFVQIKASVIQNSRRNDLWNGILMPDVVPSEGELRGGGSLLRDVTTQ
jgi:hypothetical protein